MLTITNEDNMEMMARYPDKYFDLAIVDPPYGININMNIGVRKGEKKKHKIKKWDKFSPDKTYFDHLFRVSKKCIIWGGNYFTDRLYPVKSWIVWNKQTIDGLSFGDGELAWTDINTPIRIADIPYCGGRRSGEAENIHPTQKPVALYKWLLHNYAKEGDKILDTHLGSGSIAIACHDYKFDLTACELDTEYYDAAMKRINAHVAQTKMF